MYVCIYLSIYLSVSHECVGARQPVRDRARVKWVWEPETPFFSLFFFTAFTRTGDDIVAFGRQRGQVTERSHRPAERIAASRESGAAAA